MSEQRRHLETRQRAWVAAMLRLTLEWGWRPNAVSVASIVVAAFAAASLLMASDYTPGGTAAFYYVAAAVFIQLRLLCNMLDGLLAVEGKLGSPVGGLYNDLPDRIADTLILVAAGYSVLVSGWGPELGWLAATLSLLTAYVRVLGVSLGTPAFFTGPAAKQHRMALMTAACIATAVERAWNATDWSLVAALAIVAVGAAITVWRRIRRVVGALEGE